MSKILIVDDSSTMRKIIKTALKKLEIDKEIIEAENGAEALGFIVDDKEINCVFLDINMPVMSGIELIERLKEQDLFKQVDIIINSTEVSQMQDSYIDELGVTGVIPKPLKRDDFNNILIPLFDLIDNKPQPKYNFESKILIVDESVSVRKVIKKILMGLGCKNFFEAKHGKAALEVVAENEVDVILTDVDLPIMNGIAFLEHLDKCMLLEEIKTVIVSSKVAGIEEVLGDIEISDTIAKPFEFKHFQIVMTPLLKKIENIIDDEPVKKGSTEEDLEEDDSLDGEAPEEIDEDAFEIPLGMSLEDTFVKYFTLFENTIEQNRNDLYSKNTLNFLAMKRFILTAYNNLFDIDQDIENKVLKNYKSKLLKLEKVYGEFIKRTKMPIKYCYEMVFLENQSEYLKYNKKLEDNKRTISFLKGQTKALDSRVKHYKAEAGKIKDKKSVTYKETVTNYKKNNKSLADTMHKISVVQEETKEILELITAFRDKYYVHFVGDFKDFVKKYKADLIQILNVSCYEFDNYLWKQAKESRQVQSFFKSANIDGGYSSQTFLEYYLRTVKREQANEENQKLFELLDYLKKENNKNIAIVYPDTAILQKMKSTIEKANSTFRVQMFISEKKLIENLKETPHLVILDYQMKGLELDVFLVQFKNKFKIKQKDFNFCLLFEKSDKSLLMSAMEDGVLNAKLKNYLIKPQHINKNVLLPKITTLI